MKTIQQSTYLYDTQRQLKLGRLLMWAIILSGAFIFTFLIIRALQTGYPWFAIYLTVAYPIAIYVNPDRKELFSELKHFSQGILGENNIQQILEQHLSDEYLYIKNYTVPNTFIGDIDGILIGPKGIILIEVKNWLGEFLIRWKSFLNTQTGSRRSPYKQIENQEKVLSYYLRSKGIQEKPQKLLVLVGGSVKSIQGKTGTYTLELQNLTKHLDTIKKELPESEIQSIYKALLQ